MLAATALSVLGSSQVSADLVHRWSFNDPAGDAPDALVINDSVSGSPATVRGDYQTLASFDGAALRLPGTSNGNHSLRFMSPYLDLPNGIISSKTHLTIEIWATPHSANNFDRLFDFGSTNLTFGPGAQPGEIVDINGQGQVPGVSGGVDRLYISLCVGNDPNLQRIDAGLPGSLADPGLAFDASTPTTLGTRHHYVMTFEDGVGSYGPDGGRVRWYRDGTLLLSSDVDFQLAELNDVNNWLGRSQWTNDWNADVSYDEVRIWDHALTPADIANNLSAGPDSFVGVPAPTPDHLWTFNVQADSTPDVGQTFTDEIGGTWVATLRGNGARLNGTDVVLPGTTTGNETADTIAAYLDFSNGMVSASASVSFEAWVTPLSSRNWQRLFDFGRCVETLGPGAAPGEIIDDGIAPVGTTGYDNLSLSLNDGGNIDSQQLEGEFDDNGPVFSFSNAVTAPGTEYHYVLVVEDGVGSFGAGGCQVRWYRDGSLQNTMDFGFHLDEIEDVNNWIGRSLYSNDSNSHLSLDEFRIYRRAISPEEVVASFAAGPDPTSGPPEPPAPQPVPVHLWDFNAAAGSPVAGTGFVDAASGQVATLKGNGGTLTGTHLQLGEAVAPTTSATDVSNISAYLELPNGLISSFTDLTVEGWITPHSSQFWQRVWDFGNCTTTHGDGAVTGEIIDDAFTPAGFEANDNLFLSMNAGGDLGEHRLAGKLNAGGETGLNTDLSASTTANQEYHFVMTVEDGAGSAGGCRVRWFRDAMLQASIDLPFRLRDLEDVNNWIGRSNWSGDQNSHMSINELRLYDAAITQQEIKTSFSNGSDFAFPAAVATDDEATVHAGQKVLVEVLENDGGAIIASSVEIVSAPGSGTAVPQADGRILFTHDSLASGSITFTYRVNGLGGWSAPATVTIETATSLRIDNPSLTMPTAPPSTAWQLEDALPGLGFNQPLCIASIPGEPERLFVCERMARIQHVPDLSASTLTQNTFLDLFTVVAGRTPTETIEGGGNGEHGLLGLAFHPDYASNGHFFVAYTVRINGGAYYQRISRFTVSAGDPNVADPSSELILLQQLDEGSNHDGGDLHFGPDGYLYYAAGDEENPRDFRLNSQVINKDFFTGIFRLDVDLEPEDYTVNDGTGSDDDSIPPNSHPAIVLHGGYPAFEVPLDNPFVHTSLGGDWDGTYNGETLSDLSTVRTEFWATGLRHVWRMSFDSATGDLWAGDVGQDTYEEVNKVVRGGNYGWVYREGAHDTNFTNPSPPTKPAGFTSIDPVREYLHGNGPEQGNSVVGGYVYRGSRFPDLYGFYIFSDSVSGHVWKMGTTTGSVTRLTGLPGAYGVFSAQGLDPRNGDLLFAAYNDGKIMRLATADVGSNFPQTLSETGLFSDLTDLSPSPGLLPYEPNLRFWSDHADKTRWFAIPDGIGTMTWQREGPWDYPEGMIWVKHFNLALTRGDPLTNKRIETRVLVQQDEGVYGVSYRWNDTGTEAYLVADEGEEFNVEINDGGTIRSQRWEIPGRSNCLTCHADRPLSFNTRQLNRMSDIHGFAGNQIELLSDGGYLSNTPHPVETLHFHVRPDEAAYPLEQRVRSYLDVNCAYCHQDGGSVAGFWDGREELTLDETGLIYGLAVNNAGNPANQYVVPGDTTHSILLSRVAAANGFNRMPPLATNEPDDEAVALLTDWILSELPGHVLYDEFATVHGLTGGRDDDDDGDGVSNYDEYLLGRDPNSANDPASTAVTGSGNSWAFSFTRLPFRIYDIRTSTDLNVWESWSVPENTLDYGTTSEAVSIPIDFPEDPARFFRLEVSEP